VSETKHTTKQKKNTCFLD